MRGSQPGSFEVAHGLVRAGDQVTIVCRESEAGDPPGATRAAPRSVTEAEREAAGACGAADSEPPGRLRVQRGADQRPYAVSDQPKRFLFRQRVASAACRRSLRI